METVDEGGLYYLDQTDGIATLEQRPFGYIKSDLYGFRQKDRFIITEDKVLAGFINYLIKTRIRYFFEYEIIAVGGRPQIEAIAAKNDLCNIFGHPEQMLIVVDKDIFGTMKYAGQSPMSCSPVDDLELFIWESKDAYLADVKLPPFTPAPSDKRTAKAYWNMVLRSKQRTVDDLYELICQATREETDRLVNVLKKHLCLSKQ